MLNNFILFNETLNKCFITLNGSYFDDDINCTKFIRNDSTALYCFGCILKKEFNSTTMKIQQFLQYNSTRLLMMPAIVLNLVSYLVLLSFSKDYKKIGKISNARNSMNFYLKCLCIFDTLTILSKSIHEFIVVNNNKPGIKEEEKIEVNLFSCKIIYFSSSVFKITSIYLLILMSIYRLIVTTSPFKVLSSLRPKISKILFAILVLLSISYSLCNILVIFRGQNNPHSANTTENIYKSYNCNPNKTMDLTNDVVYVFFPILFLFIFNLLIHIYLTKQRRNMKLIIKNSNSIII